jgi:hypothetical protein
MENGVSLRNGVLTEVNEPATNKTLIAISRGITSSDKPR